MGHKEALDAALKVADTLADKGEEMMMAQHAEIERLQALNAELVAALKWALPLAEICLEDTRQTRLQAGHDDIGREGKHLGLWPEEIAERDAARTALKKAQSQ